MQTLPPPNPAPVVSTPAPTASPSIPYGFDDAWLGESLSTWRNSRPERARTACVAAKPSAIQTCPGGAHDFGSGYAARDLTFTFVDGRLAAISFRTSIDGFDHVTAMLKSRFSLPDAVVRDSAGRAELPHVSMTWRNGRSTIVLSDPLPDYSHLGVRMTLDALSERLRRTG